MTVLLEAIYRVSVILMKILMPFFIEIGQISSNSYGSKETLESQRNPEQKAYRWRLHHTSLQVTLQSHSTKDSMVLIQTSFIDLCYRAEDPATRSYNYNHLIVNKDTKEKSIREKTVFNKQCWGTG